MTDAALTYYVLDAGIVAGGAIAAVARRRVLAKRRADEARLAHRLRQVESDRARFGGAR